MKANLMNAAGEVVGEVDLADDVFAITPNESVVHQAVTAHLANRRQGTQSAKTRGEVSGGGKKPWKQKGTGRARVGSTRNPIWRHGGVAFAPKPRDYSQKLNKKMRRLAMRSVFSAKAAANELIILDAISFDAPSTKAMIAVFNSLKIPGGLLVAENADRALLKSISNIPGAELARTGILNVYDMLRYDHLILTQESLGRITSLYSEVQE